ncbi:MAG: hypothetical protein IMZ43_09590 [Thermoplasmata archaeon]|nr:hypothetical protein [Thermoplasmata archaeon]
MNRQKIEEIANTLSVDPQWAINTRLRFLRGEIKCLSGRLGELSRMVLGELDWVHLQLLGSVIKDVEKKQYGMKCQVNYLKNNTQPTSGISGHHIEQARNYPIEELLGETNRSHRYKCFFHEDEHPSASVKNNKLRCWVCSKSWNPIDLLMQRDGLSFMDAVKRLSA